MPRSLPELSTTGTPLMRRALRSRATSCTGVAGVTVMTGCDMTSFAVKWRVAFSPFRTADFMAGSGFSLHLLPGGAAAPGTANGF
jgi:hypothetical protein